VVSSEETYLLTTAQVVSGIRSTKVGTGTANHLVIPSYTIDGIERVVTLRPENEIDFRATDNHIGPATTHHGVVSGSADSTITPRTTKKQVTAGLAFGPIVT